MKKILFTVFISFFVIFSSCKNNQEDDYDYKDTENYEEEEEISAESVVSDFVYYLGKQNYYDAFNLTDNPDWGDYSKFSSKSAFGSITETQIKDIETVSEGSYSATVYAEIYYKDPVNGSNTFKQNFYLTKSDNSWIITDMEVVKSQTNNNSQTANPQVGEYTYKSNSCAAYLTIYEVGSDYFEFYISSGCNSGCTGDIMENLYAYKENNKWVTYTDCDLEFEFKSNYVVITENDCDYHGVDCPFGGTYYK